MTFSLDQFEWLVHRHRNEEAARALMDLIQELDRNFGRFPELAEAPLTGRQDPRNVRYVTRVAAALTLFSDESFELTDDGFRRFAMAHRWLSAIFGASAFGTADHVVRAFNLHPENSEKQFEVREKDLLKFALLYSIDSEVPLDIEAFWAKNRIIAVALFLGILSSRIVLSDAAHEKREKLLEWLPAKLKELTLPDLPAGFLHDVWMHCTYAATPKRHEIKGALNDLMRDELLRAGYKDDVRGLRLPARDKPVIVVVTDHFHSRHAVFRWFSRMLAGLRPAFRVVGVGIRNTDAPALALFDKHVVVEMAQDGRLADAIRDMSVAIREEDPDIVFYLGVGMSLQGIFLSNLRLAPIQIASLGHPATTKSGQIDYFLLEEFHESAAAVFSERLLLVPDSAFVSIPPPKPDFVRSPKRPGDPVNVAVVLSLMKLNPQFIRSCRQILDQSRVPMRMHFLLGGSFGVTTMYVDNLIRRVIPEAVVYPQMPPEMYFRALAVADMCLDPFPFGNATSFIDYASEGVPSLCLLSDRFESRLGALMAKRLGLPDWIVVKSVDEYVAMAVELAADPVRRSTLGDYLKEAFLPSNINSLPVFSGDAQAVCRTLLALLKRHDRIQKSKQKLVKVG